MGRFNFTLIGSHGRITGVVIIPTENRTREEIEGEAHRKIRALADEFTSVAARHGTAEAP